MTSHERERAVPRLTEREALLEAEVGCLRADRERLLVLLRALLADPYDSATRLEAQRVLGD